MLYFRRLLVSRAATRLPAWAPLRAGFRWKSTTTPTATGSQDLPALPRLDAKIFAFYKERVDNIILKNSSGEEEVALIELSKRVSTNCRVFVDKALQTKSETLLGYWRLSVRSCSSVDRAVHDFFRYVNFSLETNLSQEDLKDLSLLEWGRAFVEVRFRSTLLLTYDELIPALRKEMLLNEDGRGYNALTDDHSQLAGLRKHDFIADEHLYQKFQELLKTNSRTHDNLHFICGDSGSGKTHFALNSVPSTFVRDLENEQSKSCSGLQDATEAVIAHTEKEENLPIVFYINAESITTHDDYDELCERDEKVKSCSDKKEKSKRHRRRNRIACRIILDIMTEAISPYRLRDAENPKRSIPLPICVIVLDEAVAMVPMLHSLTARGFKTTITLLNKHLQRVFSHVRVVATSTASTEYIKLLGSSRSSMCIFNMEPSRKLMESQMKDKKLLHYLFSEDDFFFFVTHNKRCTSEALCIIESNASTFECLNTSANLLFKLMEHRPHMPLAQRKNRKANLTNLKGLTLSCWPGRYADRLRPFENCSALDAVDPTAFADIMKNVSAWLNKHAVLFYKSQNSLEDRSAAQCRDIVMRGVFLCATGKPAKLHKFKEDGVSTTGKDLRSTLLSKEEIEKATADDPITTGVVAVLHSGKDGEKTIVTYSIGLHHLAMAMLNYFECPQKHDSGELLASGSGAAGDKQQQQPRQPLAFTGKETEGFFGSLFTFLCQCVLEARVRGDVLSLQDALAQFQWPPAEASVPMTAEEREVWDALNTASEDMTSVMYDKCALPCPYVTRGRITKTAFRVFSQRAFNQLNNKLKQKKGVVSVVMNGENAPYADVVIRCGKLLLLVSVKRQYSYGLEKMALEEDTAKLGFSFDGADALEGYQEQLDATKSLAKSLDCDYAVPVFALFKEPHGNLSTSLPTVNVSKNGVLMMKPIVLYIKPYMECQVKTTDMPFDE